jgi:NAD(P)-dependent dehydrogenase (short-subunit alcohol dehydrogenase family)
MKHGARAMTETGGSIVVMASMNAWHALPAQSAYTASKHAVLGLVRTAALDLGVHGIRVNAIGPGPVAPDALRSRLATREREGGLSVEDAMRQAAAGTALAADVTAEDEVERAVVETVRRYGRLDVVVANAGVVPPWSDTPNLDLAALDSTLAVNVRGVAATMKHGARAMTETGGSIVVMASMNAWHALPAQSAYTASKHAVLGLVRTAALDLGVHGIRVNAIGPGPVATDALRRRLATREREGGLSVEDAMRQAAAGTALGRMVTEGDVAGAALFLASDLSSGITGALVPVDAGLR